MSDRLSDTQHFFFLSRKVRGYHVKTRKRGKTKGQVSREWHGDEGLACVVMGFAAAYAWSCTLLRARAGVRRGFRPITTRH